MAKNSIESEITQSDSESSGEYADIDQRRRNLTRVGLAAPILMSFSGRSALANVCVSPSRVFSGNASPHNENFNCGGRSPGYWKVLQHHSVWPVSAPTFEFKSSGGTGGSGVIPLSKFQGNGKKPPEVEVVNFGAAFESVFLGTGGMIPIVDLKPKDPSRPLSMWEVLAYPSDVGGNEPIPQLARHLIAAYFNFLTIENYPVNETQIKEMWLDGRTNSYCPIASCTTPWGPEEIIDYLKTTFDSNMEDD